MGQGSEAGEVGESRSAAEGEIGYPSWHPVLVGGVLVGGKRLQRAMRLPCGR